MNQPSTSRKPYTLKKSTGIMRALKQGLNGTFICAEYDCVPSTLTYYRKKLGIRGNKRGLKITQ